MASPQDRPKAYSYVRMSTDMQLKGHSRQRQIDASANYAATHGLELVDDLPLEDIGVSAFKGDNITQGHLGRFLQAVKEGRVRNGSYLIVESLDRLSRQQILSSQALLVQLLQAGINVVTLQDEHVYRAEDTRFEDLIVSLAIMSRAHEESLLKSQRVGAAWANKRVQAEHRPMTKLCPSWLRLSPDRTQYEILEEKAKVIKSIFEDTAAGIGSFVITKRLNEQKVPGIGRSKSWQRSYVAKILTNRAVLGEYQPCRIVSGKRVPTGGPFKDYFPAIVPEDLFYRAQQGRSDRRINARGRKGKYLTNLFSGVATCAYCHSRMTFENKGTSPKGGTFLVCSDAKRGHGCVVTTGWRYDHFEKSFLAFVDQLDLPALITNENSEKKALEDKIQALQGEQLAVRAEMEKVYQLLQLSPVEFVAEKLNALQKREAEIVTLIKETEAQKLKLESSENEFRQSKEEVKSLITRLQTPGENDLYKLRSQVAARIKGLVETLEVAPIGKAPKVAKAIDFLSGVEDDQTYKTQVIDQMKVDMDKRYFLIGFKNGDVLAVYPKRDDPLQFERRVVAGKAELFPGQESAFLETEIGRF